MLKRLVLLVIIFISLFFCVSKSFAYDVTYNDLNFQNVHTSTSISNPTQGLSADGLTASPSADTFNLNFDGLIKPADVPDYAIIKSFYVSLYGIPHVGGNIKEAWGNQSVWCNQNSYNHSVAGTYWYIKILGNQTVAWATYCDENQSQFTAMSADKLPNIVWRMSNSSPIQRVEVDRLEVDVTFTIPESSATTGTVTASSSAALTYMNLSGDVGWATPSATTCEIGVYQKATGLNININSFPFATIYLNNIIPRTSSIALGNNKYQGYGWTTSNTTWNANNVALPLYLNSNFLGGVSFKYTCYPVGNSSNVTYTKQGLDTLSPNYTPTLEATPSALTTPPYITKQCSGDIWGSICMLQQAIGGFFNNLISYITDWLTPQFCILTWCPFATNPAGSNSTVALSNINSLYTSLQTHAPFAYLFAINTLGLSATDTTTQSAITIPITTYQPGADLINGGSFTYTGYPDSSVTNFFNTIKTAMQVVIWFFVILYIAFRFKNGVI
jgi:hypothetical protein